MTRRPETWKLICLRHADKQPTLAELAEHFTAEEIGRYAKIGDVHPADVEAILTSDRRVVHRIVATLSIAVIDWFCPTSISNVWNRLWFYDDRGLRRISRANAKRFYKSYDVGIMHPHSILRMLGLW